METKILHIDLLGKLNPKKYEWAGILITLFFIGFGIYLIYKYRKLEGFWIGFVALALMGCSVTINKQSGTSTATT